MKAIIYIIFLILFNLSCKTQENLPVKENPPSVITMEASSITQSSAILNSEVTDEGFTTTFDRGFVYSDKNTNPSVNDSKVQSGYGKGIYSVKLSNLILNTKYYYKAYATNSKGTAYGGVQSFTTADFKIPTVTTDAPLNTTYFSTDLVGSVTDAGGLTITQRGFCYGLNPNPTTSDNKVISGEGLGAFKINIQNLKDNSRYYVRAYAINSKGTGYGNEQAINTTSAPTTPRDNTTKIVEVKSSTGKIWMDRNLGASRVATSSNDEASYGDLYQWGRRADGHQIRNSATTSTLSSTDVPGNGNFIFTTASPYDWRSGQNSNLWKGVNGTNNPCPVGYRLPTDAEWNAERSSWDISYRTSAGAFASPLKLPSAGVRSFSNGGLGNAGATGNYWSSTVANSTSGHFYFTTSTSYINSNNRAFGFSVRCIKD